MNFMNFMNSFIHFWLILTHFWLLKIAETSLTIDGIVYVVDSGFSKQKVWKKIDEKRDWCKIDEREIVMNNETILFIFIQ